MLLEVNQRRTLQHYPSHIEILPTLFAALGILIIFQMFGIFQNTTATSMIRRELYPMQGTELKLSKGDWVFHPRMPDWGYGKVLELIDENKGRVFFLLGGEKKLSWEHAGLDRVESDMVSQTALNEQFAEFKVNLAKDLLTSQELNQGVICTPCESFRSKCELCKSASGSLRDYSLTQKGKISLCDTCRDKIMLETMDRVGINQSIMGMEKRGKKGTVDKAKKNSKLKILRK